MTQVMTSSLGVLTSATITASVVTDDHAFAALASDWDELLDQSDQRSFFMRWAWNQLWWRTFRPRRSRLFIVTCRDANGGLVGLAPLYWKQRRTAGVPHLRELQFLGTGIYAQTSEYLDIAARRGYEQAVADAVAGFLLCDPDWDRLCLTDIPAASTVIALLQGALGETAQITGCSQSYYIDTSADWESFTSGLTRVARANIFRRSRRVFNTYESEFRLIKSADELEPALDSLIRLHQARWHTKGEPGAFALNGSEALLREAAQIFLSEGRLRLWTLTLNKEVAAVLLGFVDNGVLHAFQTGFDPAYSQMGLGGVMIAQCVGACVRDEVVDSYDFMGGGDKYKATWTKTSWDNVSLICMRPSLHAQAFKAIEQAASIAKLIIRKTVPRRLKLAAHKFIMRRRYYS